MQELIESTQSPDLDWPQLTGLAILRGALKFFAVLNVLGEDLGTVHYIWEGRGWVIKWGDLKFSGRSGGGGVNPFKHEYDLNHCHYIDYTMLQCCLCACSHL